MVNAPSDISSTPVVFTPPFTKKGTAACLAGGALLTIAGIFALAVMASPLKDHVGKLGDILTKYPPISALGGITVSGIGLVLIVLGTNRIFYNRAAQRKLEDINFESSLEITIAKKQIELPNGLIELEQWKELVKDGQSIKQYIVQDKSLVKVETSSNFINYPNDMMHTKQKELDVIVNFQKMEVYQTTQRIYVLTYTLGLSLLWSAPLKPNPTLVIRGDHIHQVPSDGNEEPQILTT